MSKNYQHAQEALVFTLKELLNKNTDTTALVFAGVGVYREVKNLALSKNNTTIPQGDLTKILNGTRRLISGTLSDIEFRDELEDYCLLIKQTQVLPWAKLLSNTMIIFASTLILVIFGMITFSSFGLIAPLSILNITFGHSISSGILASGIGTFFGAGLLMKSGVAFNQSLETPPLAREMKATLHATSAHCGTSI